MYFTKVPEASQYLPMDLIDNKRIVGTISATLTNGPRLVDGVVNKARHFNGNSESAEFNFIP